MSVLSKGFTLVELLVSIALLSLVIFGVAQLFPRGLAVVRRAESITTAANLAQAQIETALSRQYQEIPAGTYEARHTVPGNLERQTVVTLLDPDTLAPSAVDLGLKRVQVTVFYPTIYGEKSYVLSTFLARR